MNCTIASAISQLWAKMNLENLISSGFPIVFDLGSFLSIMPFLAPIQVRSDTRILGRCFADLIGKESDLWQAKRLVE